MDRIDPSKAYRLLEAGPIEPVKTADQGRPNIMTNGRVLDLQQRMVLREQFQIGM